MNRICQLIFLLCLGAAAIAAPAPVQTTNPRLFENEIKAFEAADKINSPPTNAILFLGSSTIRKWTTLARDFPGRKVLNRGFGGSRISDSVYYFDRIVLPYKPKMIVFYAGSNDIQGGKTPETVVEDWKAFMRKVESALPETKVAFISINASPSRWKDVEKVRQANREIAKFMAQNDKRAFIDTFQAMLDISGIPRPELYVQDRLHLNAKGYAIWIPIIAPYLGKAE
jgi:lysophospholipase L1-like esterase